MEQELQLIQSLEQLTILSSLKLFGWQKVIHETVKLISFRQELRLGLVRLWAQLSVVI